jgi:hypothetical protein
MKLRRAALPKLGLSARSLDAPVYGDCQQSTAVKSDPWVIRLVR